MLDSIWRRSRRCDANDCTEARIAGDDVVEVRDSTSPETRLRVTFDDWRRLVSDLRTR